MLTTWNSCIWTVSGWKEVWSVWSSQSFVVNAHGLIIGDNEDHVDDSSMEVCWYLYVTTVEISPLRFGIWKDDLTCYVLLISILIDPINFRIERTATVKVSVFVFGGLTGVTLGVEQLHFESTVGVELSNGSRLRGTSLNSSSANTLHVKSKIGWNFSFVGNCSKNYSNSVLVAPPKPSEAFRANIYIKIDKETVKSVP